MENSTGRTGHRPSPVELSRQIVDARGVDVKFFRQRSTTPISWSFKEPHHIVAVYLRGRHVVKEVEFGRLSGRIDPVPGNAMVVPAEHRLAVQARGTIEFCLLSVPVPVLGNHDVRPRKQTPDPLLHQLVLRIYAVAARDDIFARLLLESLSESTRLHLKDRYGSPARRLKPASFDHRTQTLLVEFLEDNLDRDIQISSLAALAGMATRQFSTTFRTTFHVPPHQYLLNRRTERAKRLLATTNDSITEISIAVGFSTPSHFANTFKARVGVAPTAYRDSC